MKSHVEDKHGKEAWKKMKDSDVITKRADLYMWICLSVVAETYTRVHQAAEERRRRFQGNVAPCRRGMHAALLFSNTVCTSCVSVTKQRGRPPRKSLRPSESAAAEEPCGPLCNALSSFELHHSTR